MKKALLIPLSFALLCIFILFACKEKTAASGTDTKIDSAFMLTPDGLGELRMGMSVAEVEKVLGGKITLMNKDPEVWIDSAEVKYKEEPTTLFFDRRYKTDESFDLVLGGLKTTSSKIKTRTGVGVGSDKEEVWEAYREGYDINLYRDYEDTTYTTRSKTRSFIYVTTGEGDNSILFSLVNNKVTKLELNRNYDDEE